MHLDAEEIERIIVPFKLSLSAAEAYTQPSKIDELVCNLSGCVPESP